MIRAILFFYLFFNALHFQIDLTAVLQFFSRDRDNDWFIIRRVRRSERFENIFQGEINGFG